MVTFLELFRKSVCFLRDVFVFCLVMLDYIAGLPLIILQDESSDVEYH